MNRRVVLITGASSGLGKAVAEHLCEKGFCVYAGARSFNDVVDKCNVGIGSMYKVHLDVTRESSVIRAIECIMKIEGRLDVVINAAAILILGAAEDMSIEEYRQVVETNLIGTIRVCKEAAAIMRSQKRGCIINFSSINGLLATPFQSAYVASKFAVEGFTEALSLEVKDFGINVILVEPGDHRSGSKSYRLHAKAANSLQSAYKSRFSSVTRVIERDESNGSYPQALAKRIHKIINKKRPKLRYTIGRLDQRFSVHLKKFIPGRWFEKIISRYYI